MGELHNIWRKKALATLISEVQVNSKLGGTGADGGIVRLRRFLGETEEMEWLKSCINKFREKIGFPVPDHVPQPKMFVDTVDDTISENAQFTREEWQASRVDVVRSR